MNQTADDVAKLAEQVLSVWTAMYEDRADFVEVIDEETFLGIQYAELHAKGIVGLTPDSKTTLEHAHLKLIGAQEG
jgi:hypothetical protein